MHTAKQSYRSEQRLGEREEPIYLRMCLCRQCAIGGNMVERVAATIGNAVLPRTRSSLAKQATNNLQLSEDCIATS